MDEKFEEKFDHLSAIKLFPDLRTKLNLYILNESLIHSFWHQNYSSIKKGRKVELEKWSKILKKNLTIFRS